jgi:Uma2 family endonuclease
VAVTNPVALVEITSPSTEDYDRGEKLRQYQRLPSLQSVLIVSHSRRALTLVSRTTTGWAQTELTMGARVSLPQLPCLIAVDELYSAVDGLPNAPA